MPNPTGPSRRAVLFALAAGATGLAGLTGCTGDDGPDSPDARATPDPDLALVAGLLADKDALLAAYAATADRFAGLTERLRPLREDHEAHADALARYGAPTPNPSATPSAGPVVPGDRDRALAALAGAETAAAGRRIAQCENARNPELARLIAALGGCEAAHAAALNGGAIA